MVVMLGSKSHLPSRAVASESYAKLTFGLTMRFPYVFLLLLWAVRIPFLSFFLHADVSVNFLLTFCEKAIP
jgi:hypothetical protein